MRAVCRRIAILLSIGGSIAALPGCDSDSSQSVDVAHLQKDAKLRIGSLSPDQALALSDKIEARGMHDVAHLLRFVHYYKLGQRDPALLALELVNEQTAKAIVASVKERKTLEDQGAIDLDEGSELRTEMERRPVSECEEEVKSSGFKPLIGKQFCPLWDSRILDLLPTPGELFTVSGRLLARQALLRLPRQRMRGVPRLASIMARADARRVVVRQEVARHIAMEDELMKRLLDFQWNVTIDLSAHD